MYEIVLTHKGSEFEKFRDFNFETIECHSLHAVFSKLLELGVQDRIKDWDSVEIFEIQRVKLY